MIEFQESGLRNYKKIFEYKQQSVFEFLSDIFGEQLDSFVKETGVVEGFVSVYVNEQHIQNLKDHQLKDEDCVFLVSALSGG